MICHKKSFHLLLSTVRSREPCVTSLFRMLMLPSDSKSQDAKWWSEDQIWPADVFYLIHSIFFMGLVANIKSQENAHRTLVFSPPPTLKKKKKDLAHWTYNPKLSWQLAGVEVQSPMTACFHISLPPLPVFTLIQKSFDLQFLIILCGFLSYSLPTSSIYFIYLGPECNYPLKQGSQAFLLNFHPCGWE